MANAAVVAAAIIVPVAIVTGGGYWYFKADRVVDKGATSGWDWRVRREGGQYVPEVLPPAMPGFARGDKWQLVGQQRFSEPNAAKAVALNYIAVQLLPRPPGEPAGGPGQPPEIASYETNVSTLEAVPAVAVPVVVARPVAAAVTFANG